VTITGLTNTGIACPSEIMQQEQAYLATLSSVTSARIEGNVLILESPQGSLTYYQSGTPTPR
jgi:heat shock protein HslJ